MATRSVKALCIIPVMTLVLVAVVIGITPYGMAAVTMERPDQQVQQFIREITSGQTAAAVHRVNATFLANADLTTMGTRLRQRYGEVVTSSAEIRQWTPTTAVVWSRTRTNAGHSYLIEWTLVREDDRWVIAGISGVQGMAGDVMAESKDTIEEHGEGERCGY